MSRVLPRPAVVIATEVVPPDARLAGRTIHPWAWWGWALGAGVAVTLASNPLLLVLLVGAVTFVVLQRRTKAPWARSLKLYFAMAGVVIAVRLVFQILIGGLREGTVLFTLPEIALPGWAAGIRLGGPVTRSPAPKQPPNPSSRRHRLPTTGVCPAGCRPPSPPW